MNIRVLLAGICILAGSLLQGASLQGTVTDASGSAIAGAELGVFSPVGLVLRTASGTAGAFEIAALPRTAARLVVTAPGFASKSVPLPSLSPLKIQLEIAPGSDSVQVVGSTLDIPASEQASETSVITSEEIRSRNQPQASELLRTLPGLVVASSGQHGGTTSLFVRGGESTYTLFQIDGVPVNSFAGGGGFDLSQIPAESLERIEVVRGPQSAVYGPYANSGVVNFVTRSGDSGSALDVVLGGGSHDENRESVSGSGVVKGFGVGFSLSRIDQNGEVLNSDWRNEGVLLHVNRDWTRQSFSATGNFNSNEEGSPGPYGSDPTHVYPGLDLISRDKNNSSSYGFHYQADFSAKVRGELLGGFFLNNSFYLSPYGDSFNKDIRGQAESRVVVSVSRNWAMSAGVVWGREEMKNTFVTDTSFTMFPLRRDEQGLYWENRIQLHRLSLQLGVRGDTFETPLIPGNGDPYSPRPPIPAHRYGRVDPKIAAAYTFSSGTRLHASFGTGIRPPGGFDLAFTNNPDLKPERSTSTDFGLSQSLANNKIILDASYFRTRYSDLIVSLGGSLSELSSFVSDNLANARVQGAEFSAQFRPNRWLVFAGNYTYLDTRVLALDHSAGLAQNYYRVGQQLPRRPPHSGSFRAGLVKGRFTGNLIGYLRGETLDVEPNYGASAGFFPAPGYAFLAMNVNYRVYRGLALFSTVNNLTNRHYEETFGFPSPRLNFETGVKWSIRGRDF